MAPKSKMVESNGLDMSELDRKNPLDKHVSKIRRSPCHFDISERSSFSYIDDDEHDNDNVPDDNNVEEYLYEEVSVSSASSDEEEEEEPDNDNDDDEALSLLSGCCRAVRFALTKKLYDTLNTNQYTKEEKMNCWYTSEEKKDRIDYRDKIITRMETGKRPRKNMTYRGLEAWTVEGSEILVNQVTNYIDTVIDEQEAQWDANINNPQRIADLVKQITDRSTHLAILKAKNDRSEALDCLDNNNGKEVVVGNGCGGNNSSESTMDGDDDLSVATIDVVEMRRRRMKEKLDILGDGDGDNGNIGPIYHHHDEEEVVVDGFGRRPPKRNNYIHHPEIMRRRRKRNQEQVVRPQPRIVADYRHDPPGTLGTEVSPRYYNNAAATSQQDKDDDKEGTSTNKRSNKKSSPSKKKSKKKSSNGGSSKSSSSKKSDKKKKSKKKQKAAEENVDYDDECPPPKPPESPKSCRSPKRKQQRKKTSSITGSIENDNDDDDDDECPPKPPESPIGLPSPKSRQRKRLSRITEGSPKTPEHQKKKICAIGSPKAQKSKMKRSSSITEGQKDKKNKKKSSSKNSAVKQQLKKRSSKNQKSSSAIKGGNVSFGSIRFRYYEQIPEINPGVTTGGVAIGYGWTYDKEEGLMSIEDYESERCESRRPSHELVMPRIVREGILKQMGFTQKDITDATRNIIKAKHQRLTTVQSLQHQIMEEAATEKRTLQFYDSAEVEEIMSIIIDVMGMVKIKDRRYHLRQYKKCFIGSQLIDVLMDHECANTRKDALQLALHINKRLNLFRHVVNGHALKDEYLFYRFTHAFETMIESNSKDFCSVKNEQDVEQ